MAPLAGLQEQMRAAEATCSEQLAQRPGEVIIVDGPLPPLRLPTAVIVGYVKRMQRGYLGPPEVALLAQLGPGERTPVFAILNDGRHRARYSWYVRLAPAAPFAHAFAGVARLEVSESIGIADAVRIADLTRAPCPGSPLPRTAILGPRRTSSRWARWSSTCGTGWAIPPGSGACS